MPGVARATISGGPPWSLATTGRPAGQRLHQHQPVRLGLDRREREHVEVGHDVGDVVARLEQLGAGRGGDPGAEVGGVRVLTEHRAPDDHELQLGALAARAIANASSSTSSPFSGSRRATAPTTRHVVGEVDAGAERARVRGRELLGIEVLVEHDDVGGVELRGDRVRHRDHARREVSAQRALDAQRGARLHDDLARVHDVRDGRARAPRPSRTRSAASWSARRRRGGGARAR